MSEKNKTIMKIIKSGFFQIAEISKNPENNQIFNRFNRVFPNIQLEWWGKISGEVRLGRLLVSHNVARVRLSEDRALTQRLAPTGHD